MNAISLVKIWNHTQQHPFSKSGRAAALLLASMHDPDKYSFPMRMLKEFDRSNREAALDLIAWYCKPRGYLLYDWLEVVADRSDSWQLLQNLAIAFKAGSRSKEASLRIGKFEPFEIDFNPDRSRRLIDKMTGDEMEVFLY